MPSYTSTPSRSSHVDSPFNPGRRHRANFARQAVFAEFKSRDAKAILDVNIIDRRPDEMPGLSPEARL